MINFFDFEEEICKHRTYLITKGTANRKIGYLRYKSAIKEYEFSSLPNLWIELDTLKEIVKKMSELNEGIKNASK